MMPAPPPAYAIADVIARCDFWRRSPASAGGAPGHKEWSYFCVLGDEIDVVGIFSIMDRLSAGAAGTGPIEDARVTMLVRAAGGIWAGDIESCAPARLELRAGTVAAVFGASEIGFDDGAYRVRMIVGEGKTGANLCLRPASHPALTRSIPLGAANPMQWFVVPWLDASGYVSVEGRVYRLNSCAAYHDHNWGRFAWGGNFSWEWGIALSSSPSRWSLIYYRIADRARHTVVSQGLLLWEADRHRRTFRDPELTVRSGGIVRTARCFRLPRVMHLVVPESAGDIPETVEIAAHGSSDARLEVKFQIEDCARIFIPNDHDDGLTVMSECRARASVAGEIHGRRVSFDCPSIVEFNRGIP